MQTSMASALGARQVTTVDTALAIACEPDVNPIDIVALLREAVTSCGGQHKSAAFACGCQPDVWARILSGERGIHLNRLGQLDEGIQRAFVAGWAKSLRLHVRDDDHRLRVIADLTRAAVAALSEIA